MFDTLDELLAQIRLGEESRLELKALVFRNGRVAGPHADGFADQVAALANSSGGVIILGIDEAGRIPHGMTLDELTVAEQWVQAVCADRIRPPSLVRMEKWEVPGQDGRPAPILKVDVPRSLYVHESPSGYFHRVGSSKRKMSTDYIVRLVQQRSQTRLIRFDEQPVVHAALDALDPELVGRFVTPRTGEAGAEFLTKLGMAAPDDQGITHPTVAGILVASADPKRWLSGAFIQAVAYRGTSSTPDSSGVPYQLDARDVAGPLDEQVREACRFVVRNMKIGAVKGLGRRDIPQYDMTAVFEALVNAVAHRDYSIHGSKIRLRMYADRLEISSPGGIPNTMTIDSLPYRQAARNETLTSLLARCPVPQSIDMLETDRRTLMDKRGEGVGIILERSEQLSGRRPEYRLIDEAELLLIITAAG